MTRTRVQHGALCVSLVSAVAITGACGGKPGSTRVLAHDSVLVAPLTATPRRLAAGVTWDTAMRFVSVPNADLPDKIVSVGNVMVFFNPSAKRLIALDAAGRERWTVGPALPSGDTLRRIDQLRVLSDGLLAGLDSRSARLVLVRADGVVRSEVDLKSLGRATDLVELSPERLLLLGADAPAPFTVVSTGGRILQRLRFPSPRYAALHSLARAGVLGSGAGGKWVFGFRLGDGLVAFRDTTPLGSVASYPEPIVFPSVVEESSPGYRAARLGRITRAASAITVLGDRSYVLFGGTSADRNRIIDVYDYPTSGYRHSLILPSTAVHVFSTSTDLFVLTSGPQRVVLRMNAKAPSRLALQ